MPVLKIWSWCLSYVQSYLEISAVTKLLLCQCWKPTICHWFVHILLRYVITVMIACNWEKSVLLAAFWDKILMFRESVTVRSACSITLLLAWFDVALPSEREKQSWIKWTIKIISPFKRWALLCWFPARRSCFQASQHAYCARRSWTPCRPVAHTCSHFGARCRRHQMLCETARAGSSIFWRRTSQCVSLRAASCSY